VPVSLSVLVRCTSPRFNTRQALERREGRVLALAVERSRKERENKRPKLARSSTIIERESRRSMVRRRRPTALLLFSALASSSLGERTVMMDKRSSFSALRGGLFSKSKTREERSRRVKTKVKKISSEKTK